jgi:periplasmic divalent cation tolerance protein
LLDVCSQELGVSTGTTPLMNESIYVLIHSTVPNITVQTTIANKLVSSKLATCVSAVPGLISTYLWEGKGNTDAEILLLIKTRRSLAPEIREVFGKLHPYKLPELIVTPITGGSAEYLGWNGKSTADPKNDL